MTLGPPPASKIMSVNNTAVTEQPLISYICYKMAWPERLGVEMEKETRKTLKLVGLQKWSLFKQEDEHQWHFWDNFLLLHIYEQAWIKHVAWLMPVTKMTVQHNAKILKFKKFVIAAKKGCGQNGNMAEELIHLWCTTGGKWTVKMLNWSKL